MELSTGIGIATAHSPAGQAGPQFFVIIDGPPRDRLLFDSGFAFGRRAANVPVSGAASTGEIVEVRAASIDDGGASSTNWVEFGPTGPSGNFAGTISVPKASCWYRLEARLKDHPATTATAFNRFGIGHVIALWGQSEVAHFWTPSKNLTPIETLSSKNGVLRLPTRVGRKSSAALKVPGVDAMPVGWSLVSSTLTITGVTNVTAADWDFRGKSVVLNTVAGMTFRDCLFGETTIANLSSYLDVQANCSAIAVERCEFTAPGLASGAPVAVKFRTSGTGAAAQAARSTFTDCRFVGLSQRAIDWTGGLIERCHIQYTTNLDAAPLGAWSAVTSYAIGDHVTFGGAVYKSLTAANVNHQPVTSASSVDWQFINLTIDAISTVAVIGASAIRDNLIDLTGTITARLTGVNHALHLTRAPGADLRLDKLSVENNVALRGAVTTPPLMISDGALVNFVAPLIRGNWFAPSSGGVVLDPSVGSLTAIEWAGNRLHPADTLIALPANCVAGVAQPREGECVQMIWREFGQGDALIHSHLANGAVPTAAFSAMANVLMAERPGDKFAIVHHTYAGTDPRELVNDSNPGRNWATDLGLHQYATAGGSNVGLAAMSWFAAPGSLAASYGEAMFPLFTGKTLAGATVTFPTDITYGAGLTYHADHWFGELYDYTQTKWLAYGPHRFDIRNDMQDATHALGGALDDAMNQKELARISWRSMLGNAQATMFQPLGHEPMAYLNGVPDGLGDWTDMAHARADDLDGLPRLARLTTHALLQGAGLSTWQVPIFDQCQWVAGGAYVEVWSTSGPITTVRRARSETALPNTFPHWTEVGGWQIDGVYADRAEIVAGKVRIFPNSGLFTGVNAITFAKGGATGMKEKPEDFLNNLWKDYPIVDLGLYGVEGAEVRPLPASAVLANTLPISTPTFHVTTTGPEFQDTATLGASVSGITFEAKLTLRPGMGTLFYKLFSLSASTVILEVRPSNGSLRVTVKDSANATVIAATTISGALGPVDSQQTIRFAVNATAQWARTFINGTQVSNIAFSPAGSGLLPSTRNIQFLNAGGFEADIEYLRVWKTATSDGSLPAGSPFKSIEGNAATVNADPWKLGSNAT